MAYSEQLGLRIRAVLGGRAGVVEKKMFGGLAFLVDGHMCCGIVGERLMVRVGADDAEDALRQPHVAPMDFTGRPMKGMVYVEAEGVDTERRLREWVERGLRFVTTLQPKKAAGSR